MYRLVPGGGGSSVFCDFVGRQTPCADDVVLLRRSLLGGGNTASGIALLRRNGVAVAGVPCGITSGSEARGSGIGVRFGGGRATRVCHRVHYYAEVGRCGATPCKPVRLCASK